MEKVVFLHINIMFFDLSIYTSIVPGQFKSLFAGLNILFQFGGEYVNKIILHYVFSLCHITLLCCFQCCILCYSFYPLIFQRACLVRFCVLLRKLNHLPFQIECLLLVLDFVKKRFLN